MQAGSKRLLNAKSDSFHNNIHRRGQVEQVPFRSSLNCRGAELSGFKSSQNCCKQSAGEREKDLSCWACLVGLLPLRRCRLRCVPLQLFSSVATFSRLPCWCLMLSCSCRMQPCYKSSGQQQAAEPCSEACQDASTSLISTARGPVDPAHRRQPKHVQLRVACFPPDSQRHGQGCTKSSAGLLSIYSPALTLLQNQSNSNGASFRFAHSVMSLSMLGSVSGHIAPIFELKLFASGADE